MFNFTETQIAAAIEAEVADWARFFDADERQGKEFAIACEKRRTFHRANINQNHLGVLKQYLGIVPVLAYRLEECIDNLKKLAKKAERYGTEKITWTIGEQYEEERRTDSGRKYKVNMVDLNLSTVQPPRVGNFTFVAKVELAEGGAIIDTVPGEILPPDIRARVASGDCDHCGVKTYRKHLFICREVSGRLVQVGHTCLRDYMGTDTPASVAARFRFWAEVKNMDEEFGGRGRGFPDSALELLAVTSVAIRLWGWVPRSAPEHVGTPTADRIAVWFSRGMLSKWEKEDLAALQAGHKQADYDLAQAAMDWVADAASGDSEYIQNLRVILAPGAVESKRRGYACSAVAAYQRHVLKVEQTRKEREAKPESKHVGEEGQRLRDLTLKVVSSRGIGGWGGETVLYKFEDEEGNVLTWFASSSQELEVGKEYTLDASVKKHGEYNGVKETMLTRGKLK